MTTVYLDNAATTFPKPQQVIEVVSDCLNNYAVNPRRGRNRLVTRAEHELHLARALICEAIGCLDTQLVFVPSATFAINLVMQGLRYRPMDHIYLSPFEHNASVRTAQHLKLTRGINWSTLPIRADMTLDADAMRRAYLISPPTLVVVTHASNVTGDLLPIREIIELTHEFGGRVLVDAAQTAGLHTPRLSQYDYDFMAFSSHKGLYGMLGAGGLVIRNVLDLPDPLVYGGTGMKSEEVDMPSEFPERFEVGTQPLPSIISMRAGLEWIRQTGAETIRARISTLCDELVSQLDEMVEVQVVGRQSALGNAGLVSFTVRGISPQELNGVLDSAGICVRVGLHCAPLAHRTIQTLHKQGTIRVSPGFFNTSEHIQSLVETLRQVLGY